MKLIHAGGIAVLLGIVAAWWFTKSEDETSAMSEPAGSSDFDASQQTGANVATLPQQGLRKPVSPSIESTAGRGAGSGSAIAAPGSNPSVSAPRSEQIALRDATETIAGQLAGSKSSQPTEIDKTACEAAAKTLEESSSIFDVSEYMPRALTRLTAEGGRSMR